ncbi:MAG: UDP-N-acetylmuramoyl-tripeptide--D-alanyl-D-alanine ligase [bacterium]
MKTFPGFRGIEKLALPKLTGKTIAYMDFTLQEFLTIKNYHFEYHGAPEKLDQEISGVSTDSRTIRPNEIFFALRGDLYDGHNFVQDVFRKNAAVAVVEKSWWQQECAKFENQDIFVVENSVTALQEAARFYRKKFDHPIIAITGSNGKTTTKEMVAVVLSELGLICKTEGNLNNHIGVPLTLFRLTKHHWASVLELGTNHFGELARLCEMADPQYGLITNIGHGHLEFFGDLAGVAKAKMELFDYLSPNGTAFINIDDPWIVKLAPKFEKCITYGFREEAKVFGQFLGSDDMRYPSFTVQGKSIKINLFGQHNVYNALAAVAVGLEFGVSLDQIKPALENIKLPSKRMEVLRRKNIVILNDSYNANPDSTRAALEVLSQIANSGRKIFVFGDMLELGKSAPAEHAKIGRLLKDFKVDAFLAYGPLSEAAVQQARKSTKNIVVQHFVDKNDLISTLKELIQEGDIILVKGSRGMKMEEIIDKLF